eukprot:4328278-Amphidinium_carterae.2
MNNGSRNYYIAKLRIGRNLTVDFIPKPNFLHYKLTCGRNLSVNFTPEPHFHVRPVSVLRLFGSHTLTEWVKVHSIPRHSLGNT